MLEGWYKYYPPSVLTLGLYLFYYMRKAIVFIDGNNWYHNCKKIIDKPKIADFNKLANLLVLRFDLELLDVRYYNSVPSVEDVAYEKHVLFMDDLRKKGITVIERELWGRGKYKREKGVDVLIAIDMIEKCLIDEVCDTCILVSGDSDFIPVIDLIKKKKKEVIVSSVYSGFSRRLRCGDFRYLILKREDLDKCIEEYNGK